MVHAADIFLQQQKAACTQFIAAFQHIVDQVAVLLDTECGGIAFGFGIAPRFRQQGVLLAELRHVAARAQVFQPCRADAFRHRARLCGGQELRHLGIGTVFGGSLHTVEAIEIVHDFIGCITRALQSLHAGHLLLCGGRFGFEFNRFLLCGAGGQNSDGNACNAVECDSRQIHK